MALNLQKLLKRKRQTFCSWFLKQKYIDPDRMEKNIIEAFTISEPYYSFLLKDIIKSEGGDTTADFLFLTSNQMERFLKDEYKDIPSEIRISSEREEEDKIFCDIEYVFDLNFEDTEEFSDTPDDTEITYDFIKSYKNGSPENISRIDPKVAELCDKKPSERDVFQKTEKKAETDILNKKDEKNIDLSLYYPRIDPKVAELCDKKPHKKDIFQKTEKQPEPDVSNKKDIDLSLYYKHPVSLKGLFGGNASTGKNELYEVKKTPDGRFIKNYGSRSFLIEKGIVKPVMEDSWFTEKDNERSERYFICPYRDNGKGTFTEPMPESEVRKNYPGAWNYFIAVKDQLTAVKKPAMYPFYAYARIQGMPTYGHQVWLNKLMDNFSFQTVKSSEPMIALNMYTSKVPDYYTPESYVKVMNSDIIKDFMKNHPETAPSWGKKDKVKTSVLNTITLPQFTAGEIQDIEKMGPNEVNMVLGKYYGK